MTAKRWIYLSDTHGDEAEPKALQAAREFVRDYKADIRIDGGDTFNVDALMGNADADQILAPINADVDAGKAFHAWYKPHVWLMGNHDDRIQKWIKSPSPVRSRFACQLWREIADNIPDTKILPYHVLDGIYQLGGLKFVHGFCHAKNAGEIMANAFGFVVFGHTHRQSTTITASTDKKTAWNVGALCQPILDYAKNRIASLSHVNGFAYGEVRRDGSFTVHLARIVNGSLV